MHESWRSKWEWVWRTPLAVLIGFGVYLTIEGEVGPDWWVKAGLGIGIVVVIHFALIGFFHRYSIPFPVHWEDETKDEYEARLKEYEADFKQSMDERGDRWLSWLEAKLGSEEENEEE